MVFNPEEFLRLAQELVNLDSKHVEAARRTIVSRAYHAAILYAYAVLKALGHSFTRDYPLHEQVTFLLKDYLGLRIIADQLDYLYKLKRKADYNIKENITDKHVELALKLSHNIIDELKNMPKKRFITLP